MIEAHEEMLISHVIDGDATPAEWRTLETIAASDPLVWKRLAQAQRDSALLSAALGKVTHVADRVQLPGTRQRSDSFAPAIHLRLNRLGAWTGWAVAALVAIVASARLVQQPSPFPIDSTPAVQTAGFDSAAHAFQTYLEKGRASGEVVGEIPGKVLVETKPVRTGAGFEVIYLRQVMERTIVPDLYQLTTAGDSGQPTLVRYQPQGRSSM